MLEKLLGRFTRAQAPSRDAVLRLVTAYGRRFVGPRRSWQVKAAAWVKKVHIDRGTVAVGERTSSTGGRGFRIIDSLRPRYVVPDFKDCKLRPYVAEAKVEAQTASSVKP